MQSTSMTHPQHDRRDRFEVQYTAPDGTRRLWALCTTQAQAEAQVGL